MNYTLRPYQEECKKVGLAVLRDSKGRKVVGNFNYDPIEVCSTPAVITVKFN